MIPAGYRAEPVTLQQAVDELLAAGYLAVPLADRSLEDDGRGVE